MASASDPGSVRAADAPRGRDSAQAAPHGSDSTLDFADAVRFAWLGATGPGLVSAKAYVDGLVRVAVARP